MKRTIAALFMTMALCFAAAIGATVFTFAAEEGTGDRSVTVRTDGTESQFVADESSPNQDAEGGYIIYNVGPDGSLGDLGGATVNVRYLKQKAYLVYSFDLADDITEAYLNVVGKNTGGNPFTVSYSVGGSEFAALEQQTTGAGNNFTVTTYALTETDALSGADNTFKIKIANADAGDMVLYKMFIRDAGAVSAGNISYAGNTTADAIPNAVDSDGVCIYYNGSESNGNLYFKAGNSITFGYRFDADTVSSVAFNVGFHVDGTYTLETKVGSGDFATYTAGTPIEVGADMIYLKITNTSGGDLMLNAFSVVGETKTVEDPSDIITVRTDGKESQFVAAESSPMDGSTGYILYNVGPDQSLGSFGEDATVNIRYLKPSAYLVHQFDIANDITDAVLNIAGKNTSGTPFTVSYSVGGSEYVALEQQATGASNFSVTSYALTEEDVLSGADNVFKIKITNADAGDMILYKMTIRNADYVTEGNLSYSGNTADAMPYVVDCGGVGMYFGGSEAQGNLYMFNGTDITFGFLFDEEEFASVAFNVGFDREGAYTLETKVGSGEFAAYTAGTSIDVGADMIYLKITNTSGGDLMLNSLSAVGKVPTLAAGENANANIPADVQEAYFQVGSDAEKNYMFGAAADYEEEFAGTHSGMAVDGHQGGSAAMQVPNSRKLTAGQYLAYDFDFADAVASGKLVVYAQAGLKAMVSVDNGESYKELTASGTPSERGLFLFPLTASDAFAAENNQFRLVLEAMAETYVFAISVISDEAAAAPVTEGVKLNPRSQESMRYLVSTSGLATYYTQGIDEGVGYFFNTTSSSAVFKVPFAAGVTQTTFYVNQCANLKIELSDDGEEYTTVINNLLGGTGDVPYNAFDASRYIGSDGAVWVRITGNEGGGFVFELGFSGEPADEASGAVDMDNFGKYLVSVSNNADQQGQFLRIIGTNLGAEGLIWKLAGDVVFRLDLADDAIGVKISVQGIAAVTAEVYISADGQSWTMMGTADNSAKTFLNYDAVKDNDSNVVYIRFSSGEYYFEGFSFTTEDIEPEGDKSKPYEDGELDFNYDDPVPGIDEYEPTVLPDPEIPDGEVISKGGCGSVIGGGFGILAAVSLLAAVVAVIKKNRSAKQ